MRKIYKNTALLLTAFFLFVCSAEAQSIHGQRINDIDGNVVEIASFKGSKLLVITLSGQDRDTAIVHQLSSFLLKYSNRVAVVGVPGLEDGFSAQSKQLLKTLLAEKNVPLLLTEGMYIKKASGNSQSSFMKWLTDKNQNMHFNQEIKGVGQKFFLDEAGRLYADIGPEVSLQAPVIETIINKPAVTN